MEVESLLCVCESARNCIYPYSLWEHNATHCCSTPDDKGEMREREKDKMKKKKCTMALLQTIAVNGIIFSPQRLRWEQWTIRADGMLKIHWMLYIQYMMENRKCYLSTLKINSFIYVNKHTEYDNFSGVTFIQSLIQEWWMFIKNMSRNCVKLNHCCWTHHNVN